jgi:hypothetical protein
MLLFPISQLTKRLKFLVIAVQFSFLHLPVGQTSHSLSEFLYGTIEFRSVKSRKTFAIAGQFLSYTSSHGRRAIPCLTSYILLIILISQLQGNKLKFLAIVVPFVSYTSP